MNKSGKFAIVVLLVLLFIGAFNVNALNTENIKLKEQLNVAKVKNGDLEEQIEQQSVQIEELTNKVEQLGGEIN